MMNLKKLQDKIHQQNKELGWWDEHRSFAVFACLFHSEISEALEGDRKEIPDDHLPKYPMFWVELADFVIRCLDWLGSTEFDSTNKVAVCGLDNNEAELLIYLHCTMTDSYRAYKAGNDQASDEFIYGAVLMVFAYAKMKGVDMEKIILEKVEYNKHRADHKRENRAKSGGKKY